MGSEGRVDFSYRCDILGSGAWFLGFAPEMNSPTSSSVIRPAAMIQGKSSSSSLYLGICVVVP